MQDGFLGYKTSFMLDAVVCALALVVPILLYSIYLVKFRRKFELHKKLQIVLGILLAVAVIAFEVDIRLQGGWEQVVAKRDIPLAADQLEFVRKILYVHLVFAVSTPFLWVATIRLALKRFPNPPAPSDHSSLHKKLAWLSTLDITLTSVTGLIFYYYAFMA